MTYMPPDQAAALTAYLAEFQRSAEPVIERLAARAAWAPAPEHAELRTLIRNLRALSIVAPVAAQSVRVR